MDAFYNMVGWNGADHDRTVAQTANRDRDRRNQKKTSFAPTPRERPTLLRPGGFDPKDYEWTCPSDEDVPWNDWPDIPVAVAIHAPNGNVNIPQKVQDQLSEDARGPFARYPSNIPTTSIDFCPICLASDVPDAIAFRCGAHFYCSECVHHYIREKLALGQAPTCLEPGCDAEVGPRLCRRGLSRHDFDRYLMVQYRSTRVMDCPHCKTMLSIQEQYKHTPRGRARSNCTSASCPACKHRFCTLCSLLHNPNTSCEEAKARMMRRRKRDSSRTFDDLALALNLKKCPRCSSACEKSDADACDHMTCAWCKFEFCWLCMADRKVIYAHGNEFHMPGCRHYAPYDGPLDYKPNQCERCREHKRACKPPSQSR